SSEQRFTAFNGHPEMASERRRLIRFYTEYAVEERLPLLGARIEFARALTPEGQNVLPRQVHAGGMLPDCFRRDDAPSVEIRNPPADLAGPLTLEGNLHLWFAVGRKELRIDDVFAGVKQTAEADDIRITLLSAEKVPQGNRATIVLQMKMEESKGPILSQRHRSFGVTLVDAAGNTCGRISGWDPTKKGPEGVTMSISMHEIPQTGQLSLVYIYPEEIEERDYPFTIRDVPLP
ncbi:MAG TPA: hypothetical protein VMX57_08085, partial [Planctomycetota bacterium]|nr:hypothetical protein [Planctomycetota bacterium]